MLRSEHEFPFIPRSGGRHVHFSPLPLRFVGLQGMLEVDNETGASLVEQENPSTPQERDFTAITSIIAHGHVPG